MTRDWREEAIADYHVLLEFYERYSGFELIAEGMRAGGPPPRSLSGTPLILDVGPSPDDMLAVTCSARTAPELALVIAADHETARLVRHLLNLLGRSDVPVTSASPQRAPRHRIPAGLIPGHIPAQPSDAVGAVARVCARTTGPVRWVSTYSPATLAHTLARDPQIAARLVITLTGGTSERNRHDPLQRDVDAAHYVIATATTLYLVTTTDTIAMRNGSDLHTHLAAACTATGAGLVADHLAHWYDTVAPVIYLRAVLTLCAGLRKPFVTCTLRHPVRPHQQGQMIPTPGVIPTPGMIPIPGVFPTAGAERRRIWTTRRVEAGFTSWIRHKAFR